MSWFDDLLNAANNLFTGQQQARPTSSRPQQQQQRPTFVMGIPQRYPQQPTPAPRPAPVYKNPLDEFNQLSVHGQRKKLNDLKGLAGRTVFKSQGDIDNANWAKQQIADIEKNGQKKGWNLQTVVEDVANGIVQPIGRQMQANARVIDDLTLGTQRNLDAQRQKTLETLAKTKAQMQANPAPFQAPFKNGVNPNKPNLQAIDQKLAQQQATMDASRARILEQTDPIKYAGAAAMTGLDAATLGAGTAAVQGGKAALQVARQSSRPLTTFARQVVAPQGIKQGVQSGATLGTGYGIAGTAEQLGGQATPLDYLQGAAIGAAGGAALGAAVPVAGKAGRFAYTRTRDLGLKRPTNLNDAELTAAMRVHAAQEGLIDSNKITTREMQLYRQAETKLGEQPGTVEGKMALINAQKAHNAFDQQFARRKQSFKSGLVQANQFTKRRLVPGGTLAGPNAKGYKHAQSAGRVFDGVDGKPRFEIDDSKSKLISRNGKTVGDVLDHPELYKNYPQFKNTPVSWEDLPDNIGGSFNDATGVLRLNKNLPDDVVRKKVLHELTHNVQDVEDFAKGANLSHSTWAAEAIKREVDALEKSPQYQAYRQQRSAVLNDPNLTPERKMAIHKQMNDNKPEVVQEHERLVRNMVATERKGVDEYFKSAGEAEARAVESRMNMTDGERYVADPVVNTKTGETLNQSVKKLEGYGWSKADIEKYKKSVLGGNSKMVAPKGSLDSLNPTGGLYVDYTPAQRAKAPLADNMTTLDKTLGGKPDDMVTIYRGAPKNQKEIAAGDFVTLDKNAAQNYAGDGHVIAKQVRKGDLLDEIDSPSKGDETLYRPNADKESRVTRKSVATQEAPIPRSTFYDSLDVPKKDLIVRHDGGTAMSVEQPDQKRSRFANRTVQNSDEVSDQTKKLVREEKYMYDTTTNQGRTAAADAELAKLSDDEAYTIAVQKLENGNFDTHGQDAVTALQAAKRLDSTGDETNRMKATEIYGQLADRFSRAGQEVQAAALLASRTPDGLKYGAVRDLKKAGVTVTPEMEKELNSMIGTVKKADADAEPATKALATYKESLTGQRTPEQQAKLDQLRQAVRDAEGRRAVARDNVQYFIAKQIPSERADKVINFWRSSLLTAPTTTGGALVGNAMNTLTRKLWVNPVATFNDMVMSAFTGKRTQTLAKGGEWGKGAKRGANNVKSEEYWKTGFDPMNPTANAESMGSNKRVINYGDGRLGRATTGYVNGVYKVMGAADQPFRYGAYDEVLSSLAKAEATNRNLTGWKKTQFIDDFINEPPKAAVERATNEAMGATFQNKTALAAIMQSTIQGLKQKGHHKTAGIVQFFAPFTGVPSSVADRLIRHTPIGTANTLIKEIIKTRKGEAWDQRQVAQAFAEGSIGLPVIAAGFALAKSDSFNGAYPADPKERQRWIDEGRQENSVKVGDRWYSLNYIQPFGVLLSVGAGIAQAEGENGTDAGIGEYAMQAGASAVRSFMGQSYLEGLQGPIEAMADPEQNAEKYVAGAASSTIPNFIRSFARATDPYQRDAKGLVDGTINAIPFMNQSLPEKLDSTGKPIEKKDNGINMYFNPLKPSRVRNQNDPVIQEMGRLQRTKNGVTAAGMKVLEQGGERTKLDKRQQREYNELLNTSVHKKWGEVIALDSYRKATDDQKAGMLSAARNNINRELKKQYLAGQPVNLTKSMNKTVSVPSADGESGSGISVASSLPDVHKKVLAEYDGMNEDERKKKFNTETDAEFKYNVAKYENDKANGTLSKAQEIKAQTSLAYDKAGSSFPKEVRELYSLNKTQLYQLLSTDPKGQQLAEKILELGDTYAKAGLAKNKFRDSRGNVAIAPKAKGGGSRGGSRAGGSRGGGKADTSMAALISTTSSTSKRVANAKLRGGSSSFRNKVGKGRSIQAYKKPTATKVRGVA